MSKILISGCGISWASQPKPTWVTVLKLCGVDIDDRAGPAISNQLILDSMIEAVVNNRYDHAVCQLTNMGKLDVEINSEKRKKDLVEKLMSFGPKQLNFNHISRNNTYCFNSINRISNLLFSNSMKLISFCNTVDIEINNRVENLLIQCFNWDLADNLLDYPPLNNTWGYSPISMCMIGGWKNAILNLLERGAEFNKLNNLYFIGQNHRLGQIRITVLIASIMIRIPDITIRLLDFTNEELNLAFVNERGVSALVRVNELVLELQGEGDIDPMFIEIKRFCFKIFVYLIVLFLIVHYICSIIYYIFLIIYFY
jgi:hypothetical protein